MELTIDQALKKGIAAHKEGKFQDAERYYQAILRAESSHPAANHNLAVLALAAGEREYAFKLFKKAIDANPSVEQFWSSYIDALIKENEFDEARRTLADAHLAGGFLEKINELEKRIELIKKTHELSIESTSPLPDKVLKKQKAESQIKLVAAPARQQLHRLMEHYQNCRFAEAEKEAIVLTREFPDHPFAWKVLGAVLRQLGKLTEAINANQKALELAPFDAEVQNNLGVTLQGLGRLEEAKISYAKAILLKSDYAEAHFNLGNMCKELEKLHEAEANYSKAIMLKPDYLGAHYNLGNVRKELGKFDEAEASYLQVISLKPDYAEAHNNLGNTLKELGKLEEAEVNCSRAVALKPTNPYFRRNLGNVLKELGRFDKAAATYLKAIELNPADADVHNLLGNIRFREGKLLEAELSLRQAILFKPDFAEAHLNLGNVFQSQGRLRQAEASYREALVRRPDYTAARSNLGVTLRKLGRLTEAVTSCGQALILDPDSFEAKVNFAHVLQRTRFSASDRSLYPALSTLLQTGNIVRPSYLSYSIISLLRHDPLVKELLVSGETVIDLAWLMSSVGKLEKLPLLQQLMCICPLPDLQLEEFFTSLRRFLLGNINFIRKSSALTSFQSTLALHCFTNEYVYFESDEEKQQVVILQTRIEEALFSTKQPEIQDVLCLAAYRPLHSFDWCRKLEILNQLHEVKLRLIEQPFIETLIMVDLESLDGPSDDVSRKVRSQYEQNPYPRWVKLSIPPKPITVHDYFEESNLKIRLGKIADLSAPEILIAGCGTGQHSIETASRFTRCKLTAVDLSAPSLAYAKRNSIDLDIKNLRYLRADILDLGGLKKDFDIIECTGVLHHMRDPIKGWRVLCDLLKPGGVMKIGLYSELARRHIVKVREEISSLGIGTSEDEIRTYRHLLSQSQYKHHRELIKSLDFFALSTVRDLIFHVQEHRFGIYQIINCLTELGLTFCGMDDKDIVARFVEFHGDKADTYDLALWNIFEETHPETFIGMYQFWCQKV